MADELRDIREAEEANYQTSLKVLGDSVSLVQDLLEVHQLITTTAPKTKLVLKAEYYVALHFILAARYHLTIGSLAALRAHLTDALRSGRMAIELAAFASRVKTNPDLAMVWVDAGQSEDAYDRYTRIFPAGKSSRMSMECWRSSVSGSTPRPSSRTRRSIDSHFGVLRVFVEVIDVHMNAIDAKLTIHKTHWREAILRKPSKPVNPSALIVIPPF